jgi:hypothetical protein
VPGATTAAYTSVTAVTYAGAAAFAGQAEALPCTTAIFIGILDDNDILLRWELS